MTKTHNSPPAFPSQTTDKNTEPLYSTAEICTLIGCNRVTLWRMWTNGKFPKPLEILSNKRAWPRSDYIEWLDGKIAKRNAKG